MDDKIKHELLDIIKISTQKQDEYQALLSKKKADFLIPFEQEYTILNTNLQHQLSSYGSVLKTVKQSTSDCSSEILGVYQRICQLNLSKTNVLKCINVVDSHIDLKSFLGGVSSCLGEENYTEACSYIQKALKRIGQQGNNKNLQELTKIQENVFKELEREFNSCLAQGNIRGVLKFTKLFGVIEKKDEGIEMFCVYLEAMLLKENDKVLELNLENCKLFKSCEKDYTYATLLALLTDTFASCFERNQKFICDVFGKSRLYVFIDKIQKVANNTVKKLLTEYISKIQAVSEIEDSIYFDEILEEMSVCYERLKLFLDFLLKEFKNSTKLEKIDQDECEKQLSSLMTEYMVVNSYFFRRSVEHVKRNYILELTKSKSGLETIKSSKSLSEISSEIAKSDLSSRNSSHAKSSHESESDSDEDEESDLDEDVNIEEDQTSDLVFDFFLIFRRVLERSSNSKERQIICATINQIIEILKDDMKQLLFGSFGYLKENVHLEYGKFCSVMNGFNNVSKTCEYLVKLKNNFEKKYAKCYASDKSQMIKLKFNDFLAVSKEFNKELLQIMEKYFNLYIKSRLDCLLVEMKNFNYVLTEKEFVLSNKKDDWVQSFINGVEKILKIYQKHLNHSNFYIFIKIIVEYILNKIIQIIKTKKFNLYGGLKIDNQIRNFYKYSSQKVDGTLRDKFLVITQINQLLRLNDMKEYKYLINEYFQLNEQQRKEILNLRVDLNINN